MISFRTKDIKITSKTTHGIHFKIKDQRFFLHIGESEDGIIYRLYMDSGVKGEVRLGDCLVDYTTSEMLIPSKILCSKTTCKHAIPSLLRALYILKGGLSEAGYYFSGFTARKLEEEKLRIQRSKILEEITRLQEQLTLKEKELEEIESLIVY